MLMSWHLKSRVSAAHPLGWKPLQFTLWRQGDMKTRTTSGSSETPLSLTSQHGAACRRPHSSPVSGAARARRAAQKTSPRPRAHREKVKANLPVIPACQRTGTEKDAALGASNVRCLLQGTAGCVSVCRRLNWTRRRCKGESVIAHCNWAVGADGEQPVRC